MITIVDAMMGTGKSTWAINKVNANPEKKYIILTPLLTEVTRYKVGISEDYGKGGKRKDVIALDEDSHSKSEDFLRALRERQTIIATHKLFTILREDVFALLAKHGDYELILDETLDLVDEKFSYDDDYRMLRDAGYIEEQPTEYEGMVEVSPSQRLEGYNGAHTEFIKAILGRHVYRVNRTTIVFVVPPKRLTVFRNTYICTYLFEGSETNSWLRLYGLEFDHKKLLRDGCRHRSEVHDMEYSGKEYAAFLTVFDDVKLNEIGEAGKRTSGGECPLSANWYDKKKKGYKKGDKSPLDTLRKNVSNYFKNKMKAKGTDILWTCPASYQETIAHRYFDRSEPSPKTFLASTTRATNDFNDRHVLAFLVNVFPRFNVSSFFKRHKVPMNEERYALSGLVQWIWRSAIRNNPPENVTIYLPSRRMRDLLGEWLG